MAVIAPRHGGRFSESYDPRKKHRKSRGSMGEMNVTPFIDVLLVLLIMLILAMPIQTHVIEVDLPTVPPEPFLPINAENTVSISASDQLFWNGAAVTPDQLRTQVSAASALERQPLLRFEPAALASYDTSAQTITLIKEEGAESFAFVGNAKFKDFGS